jgi:uracil-DNA glycosylase
MQAEVALLRPQLILPVGRLAIEQFVEFAKMTDVIGKQLPITYDGHACDLIPLPHPSGASPWHRVAPGKGLLEEALQLIAAHPAWTGRM